MRILGTAFEITDLNQFVEQVVGLLSKSKLASGSKKRSLFGAGGLVDTVVDTADDTLSSLGDLLPDDLNGLIDSLTALGIVQPLANARVHLGLLPPGLPPTGGSFFPTMSVKTTTNAVGAYTLTVSDERPAQRGFLLVYQPSASISVAGQSLEFFSLLYRSSSFDLKPGDRVAAPLFVRRVVGRPEQGITQTEISKQAAAIRTANKFDDMDIRIGNQGLAVRIADRGAKVTFDIALRGSSSPNLNELIDLKVRNFAIDLPGPDFITTLCVNEKEVERTARVEASSLERSANNRIQTQIVDSVAQATGLPRAAVEAFFRENVTVSIPAINTVRQSVKVGPNVGLVPTIVLDVSLGIPRRLFAAEESKRK